MKMLNFGAKIICWVQNMKLVRAHWTTEKNHTKYDSVLCAVCVDRINELMYEVEVCSLEGCLLASMLKKVAIIFRKAFRQLLIADTFPYCVQSTAAYKFLMINENILVIQLWNIYDNLILFDGDPTVSADFCHCFRANYAFNISIWASRKDLDFD